VNDSNVYRLEFLKRARYKKEEENKRVVTSVLSRTVRVA
jgi:hypothetical protein